jgi:hypothetical protein
MFPQARGNKKVISECKWAEKGNCECCSLKGVAAAKDQIMSLLWAEPWDALISNIYYQGDAGA